MKIPIIISLLFFAAVNATPISESESEFENEPNAEIFRADFTKSTLASAFGGASVKWGAQFVSHWGSGIGCDVTYPKGSYGGNTPVSGGFGLYSNHPIADTKTAIFKYSVFFPSGFQWAKGGKLPGLYGGKQSCSGGDPAVDCFSTRLMWRANGQAELYLYANRDAQDPAICQQPNNHCNPDFGWSLNRGVFTFKTNEYTDIEQRLKMNTPGQRNGQLIIKVNGVEKIRYNNLVFRIASYPNMKVSGLHVATFFGGSSSTDFASPSTQVTKWKNFILSSE